MESNGSLVVFQDKKIRRTWFNEEWWFSVVDVIEVLTESGRARKYWADLKKRLAEEGFEVSEKIGQLKLNAEDGRSLISKDNYIHLAGKKKRNQLPQGE